MQRLTLSSRAISDWVRALFIVHVRPRTWNKSFPPPSSLLPFLPSLPVSPSLLFSLYLFSPPPSLGMKQALSPPLNPTLTHLLRAIHATWLVASEGTYSVRKFPWPASKSPSLFPTHRTAVKRPVCCARRGDAWRNKKMKRKVSAHWTRKLTGILRSPLPPPF